MLPPLPQTPAAPSTHHVPLEPCGQPRVDKPLTIAYLNFQLLLLRSFSPNRPFGEGGPRGSPA